MEIEWEYVVRTFPENDKSDDAYLTAHLDDEGLAGWELVIFDFRDRRAIFKRPKRQGE